MNILTADFHTHILPCVDDGSQSVGESVEMIRQEVEQGIETVFLTPHFSAHDDRPDVFIKKRAEAFETLQQSLVNEPRLPRFVLGTETRFVSGISSWDILPEFALGDTCYVLIEMPRCKWTEHMLRELELIYLERRMIPILAHIERYLAENNSRGFLDSLLDLPILIQSNASFFIEKRSRKLARKLLESNSIHLISSDCHGVDWRAPDMAQARAIIAEGLSDRVATRLYNDEQAVLNGRNVFI